MTLQSRSTNAEMLERAELLLERLRYKKALQEFEGVIGSEPDHLRARLGRATCLLGLHKFETGLSLLRELDPIDDPELHARRVRAEAWALILQQKWDEVLAFVDTQLPDLAEISRGRVLLYKAGALAQLKRRQEAAETLRMAWPLGNFLRNDLLVISHLGLGTGETAIARSACRRLLRTRYALGAALCWILLGSVGSDRLLVYTPISLLLVFGAPLIFGILPVLFAWGIFAALSIVVGVTHRMPYLGLLALYLAVLLGGMSAILALIVDPTLGSWAAGAIMLLVLATITFVIVRSNRRYRRRRSQEARASPPVNAAPTEPVRPLPASPAEPPVGTTSASRRRWIYLIWPAVILLIGAAFCRSATRSAEPPVDRIQAVTAGIDGSRIATSNLELGIDDVRIALFVLDLEERPVDGGAMEFTALLLNRGDYPVRDVNVHLIPRAADGRVVEVLLMEGAAGPIAPGEKAALSVVFDPLASRTRILEETLTFPWGLSFSYVNSADPLDNPSALQWISDHIPWIAYSSVTTHPQEEWEEVELQLYVGEVEGG